MKKHLMKFGSSMVNMMLFHSLVKMKLVHFFSRFKRKNNKITIGENPPKDKTLCFLLGSPRSGTSISSLILGNSKKILSPTELHLIGFDDLKQRKETMSKTFCHALTIGLIQTISKIKNISLLSATALVRDLEETSLDVKKIYDYLLCNMNEKVLIDKTPTYLGYASDDTLKNRFPHAKYLYLHRHPLSVILSQKKWLDSFDDEKYKAMRLKEIERMEKKEVGYFSLTVVKDELFYPMREKLNAYDMEHDFDKFKSVECRWRLENENAMKFLNTIPEEQKYIFSYENFLKDVPGELAKILRFLDIDDDPNAMIKVYENQKPPTSLLGIMKKLWQWEILDPNQLFKAGSIDSSRAEGWKKHAHLWQALDPETQALAQQLGYGEFS